MSKKNRFIDNQDGTITDIETSLIWLKEDGWQQEARWFTWDEAMDWAVEMGTRKFGGIQDWKLPDEEEIQTLYTPEAINKDKYEKDIHLDPVFPPGCQATVWLKSDSGHEGTIFDFKNGELRSLYKSKTGRMSVRLLQANLTW